MTVYTQVKEYRGEGEHALAVLKALNQLGGKASGTEIADVVEKKHWLRHTKMEVRQACSWILGYLVREKVLRARKPAIPRRSEAKAA